MFVRVAAWVAGNVVGAGDAIGARAATPAAASAESAAAHMHPVFGGGTHDNQPEGFRVGRDGELGRAGRFREDVAIDARAVFPGR